MITVIGSLKGGSGKSTITFNLAIWLAMAEVDVAVVDGVGVLDVPKER